MRIDMIMLSSLFASRSVKSGPDPTSNINLATEGPYSNKDPLSHLTLCALQSQIVGSCPYVDTNLKLTPMEESDKPDPCKMELVSALLNPRSTLLKSYVDGQNIMTRAARTGDITTLEAFINSTIGQSLLGIKDANGDIATTIAASKGDCRQISLFLKSDVGRSLLKGRNSEGKNAMTVSAATNQTHIIELFLRTSEGRNLLHEQDDSYMNAIFTSAFQGTPDLRSIILETNKGRKALNLKDAKNYYYMFKAVYEGRTDVAPFITETPEYGSTIISAQVVLVSTLFILYTIHTCKKMIEHNKESEHNQARAPYEEGKHSPPPTQRVFN